MRSNVPRIVSLNTKTPLRNIVPAMIAAAVSSSRPLRATTFFSECLNMASLPEALQPVEHPLGGGFGHLVDDLPVGEEDDAVGVTRPRRVVGDHHDRLAELADRLAHELEDLRAGAAVEVAGRLVGEDDRRLGREGAGDCDALLLPAAQLARAMGEAGAPAERGGHP